MYGGGKEPFSAEIYLRNANGPFAPYFRQMIPDVDSLAQLDPDHLKAEWTADVSRISSHFGLDQEDQKKAQDDPGRESSVGDLLVQRPGKRREAEEVRARRARVGSDRANPESLSYQKERVNDGRRGLEADRRALLAPLVEHQKELRDAVVEARHARPVQIGRRPRARP